ncbi:hypothetical protein EU519_00205 [Candidatus Thorarchaeota archaeon]|nr:MAG: hypothetical protein EU519_00205 [Candidatus Thorarchaeota archaeon]
METEDMNTDRVRHVLTSLMILSFLIFGGLSAIILITDTPLTTSSVSLPFAFLFVSAMTLIVTGQIDERPKLTKKYLRQWILVCVFMVLVAALAFTLA